MPIVLRHDPHQRGLPRTFAYRAAGSHYEMTAWIRTTDQAPLVRATFLAKHYGREPRVADILHLIAVSPDLGVWRIESALLSSELPRCTLWLVGCPDTFCR